MINWARINELRDEIGAEDFGEVVELFLGEVEERLDTLSAEKPALDTKDDMHFLKGSALNLGFVHLAALCSDYEQRAGDGEILTEIMTVKETFAASKIEFLSNLETEAAA